MQADLIWTPWTPSIDVGFWSTLAKKKLEEYKLDVEEKEFIGRYSFKSAPDRTSFLTLDAFSFKEVEGVKMGPVDIKVYGKFLNTNTIEEFKNYGFDEEEGNDGVM